MKTKIIILAIVMAFVSLSAADILYSGTNDGTDRLSGEQSGTFSPGYINAAKQRTDDIINQANPPRRGLIQRTMDFIAGILSSKVTEDADERVTPELKKKTGGSDGSGQKQSPGSTSLIDLSASSLEDIPQEDISADARNSIQEYMNGHKDSFAPYAGDVMIEGYEIVSTERKHMVFWEARDGDRSLLKAQVFDADGRALLSDPRVIADTALPTINVNSITALSNGNVAVIWDERGVDFGNLFKAQILDSGGNALFSDPYSIAGSITEGHGSTSIDGVSAFSNGNLAILWQETGVDYKKSLKAQIFDTAGKELFMDPYIFTNNVNVISNVISNVTVTMLSNDNLAVFWGESEWDGAGYKGSLKAQVFNAGGKELPTDPCIITDNVNYAIVDNVTVLSNGNLAVFWKEYQANPSLFSLKAQVFDASGKVLLSNPYSMADGMKSILVEDVAAFSNGNLAILWRETGVDYKKSLKAQIFDAEGKELLLNPYSLASNVTDAWIGDTGSINTLSNGNLAVFWHEIGADYKESLKAQIFGTDGKALLSNPYSISDNLDYDSISEITMLSNGSFAVFFEEMGVDFKYSTKMQVFDTEGKALLLNPYSISDSVLDSSIREITVLSNGSIAVFWNEYGEDWKTPLKVQVFDATGRALFLNPYNLTNDVFVADISNVTTLSDGNLAVFWREFDSFDAKYSFKSQILDPSLGTGMTFDSFSKSIADAAAGRLAQSIASGRLLNSYNNTPYFTWDPAKLPFEIGNDKVLADEKKLGSIFRGLLINKDALAFGNEAGADSMMLAKIVKNALGEFALALPAGVINPEDMKIASVLASIMKDPTDEQKLIIDTIQTLLQAMENQIDQSASPELKKASDDLLQMAAAILIAQAIPDLLKEGDVAIIKNTFSELNVAKSRILLEYNESTKPYYEEIKKMLSKNMALLQLNNILSKSMTERALAKLEPGELEKILEKLRKASNRSFEEEYILQQEAKYRRQYIDPSKRVLEGKMKGIMREFTAKLSKILEGAKK